MKKNGGIATNIRIHLFNMLLWLFGSVEETVITQHNQSTVIRNSNMENALINKTLSIDEQNLPENLHF